MDKDSRKSSRVGLYATISFHLVVLIVLLVVSIGRLTMSETSFVLDFSKQEQKEILEKEQELKETISRELDEMMSSRRVEVRNVAVDMNGEQLRDDRHSNPSEVYQEARDLQSKLDASRRDAMSQEKSDEVVDMAPAQSEKKESKSTYKGPSVISYSLEGRKANYLPVPAYKGYGSGDVAVEIIVGRNGRVLDASIMESISSPDESLREYAIEAAKRSRFTASSSAPAKQSGEIVYRFIAQ